MVFEGSFNPALGSHKLINKSTCSNKVTTFKIMVWVADIDGDTDEAIIVKGGKRGVPSFLNVKSSTLSPATSITDVAAPGATGKKLKAIRERKYVYNNYRTPIEFDDWATVFFV